MFTQFSLCWCADDVQKAFGKHLATYGGLDICINSAGIGSKIVFHKDETDGARTWRHVIDVNLLAVIACTQLAVCLHMGLIFLHTYTMKCSFLSRPSLVLQFGLLSDRKLYSLDVWIFNITLPFNSMPSAHLHYFSHLWLELIISVELILFSSNQISLRLSYLVFL